MSAQVLHGLAKSKRIEILAEITRLERLIAVTVAMTFFSTCAHLGRCLLIALTVTAPRIAIFAIAGLLLSHVAGYFLSRNSRIKSSGLIELNGWFFGLAIGSFMSSNVSAFSVLITATPFCVISVVALDRLLKIWDFPVLVMPYVIAVWCVQFLSKLNPSMEFVVPTQSSSLQGVVASVSIVAAALRGFGQIFYQDSLLFSGAVLVLLVWFHRSSALAIMFAALSPAIVSYFTVGHHWALDSGLCSFGGILLWAAFHQKSLSITWIQYVTLVLLSGFAELIAIQWAGGLGVFSLSLSYVALMWVGKLISETEKASKKGEIVSMPW